MSLAVHVRTLARGPGRSRSFTRDEAMDAMQLMLSGTAAPEATGALLMLLRMKGETADEIAGFAAAAQAVLPALDGVDLDWPSYAAGRTRGLPWFLLSARLVARAGHRVLLHGWNGSDGSVRAGLAHAGIDWGEKTEDARRLLNTNGIAYLPLERAHPALFALLQLRDVLGLRSCVNTVCRMLNPGRADTSIQGVFHPSYRLLQSDAAACLGWKSLCVIKGGGGEFERHPGKPVTAFGLSDRRPYERKSGPVLAGHTRLDAGPQAGTSLAGLWSAEQADPFAEAVVTGTAALALGALGHDRPDALAQTLWADRNAPCAGQEENAA
jgi:anthranilate phosphoribosyltransferase